MDKPNLNLFHMDTLDPMIVGLEVLYLETEEAKGYTTQMILVLNTDNHCIHLPTHIWEETAFEACRKTLVGLMQIFSNVSAMVPVFNTATKELVEYYNVNEMFGTYEELLTPQQDSIKKTNGITYH